VTLKAMALNATLKSSGDEPSSTDRMINLIAMALQKEGVETETIRLADHNVKPGVTSDEGPGDAWPAIRKLILDADILILGTPIWMGQPSSVAKRALERMDALHGRLPQREG
jgi:multimeric flavodoxin WrbA